MKKPCEYCGGRHTESECISPMASQVRYTKKLETRLKNLEELVQDFIDCCPMTGEDGREYQNYFESFLKAEL